MLLEPGIEYKTMISVMDKVRIAKVVSGFDVETVELFPNISIGDAQLLIDDEVEPVDANSEKAEEK